MKKVTRIMVFAILALVAGSRAYGGDVITELLTADPGRLPEIRLSWDATFHQDVFVGTDIGGAGSAFQTGNGGYVVVGQADLPLDAADRVVSYGAGNVTKVDYWDASDVRHELTGVDTTLKVAMGNLTAKSETLISAGDSSMTGPVGALDVLTNTPFLTNGIKFIDSNNNGIIQFETRYEFGVNEAGGAFYDYNRDGAVHNDPLTSAATGSVSDRPFVVIYENDNGTPQIDLTNPPSFDADGDGIKVDNLWVGNPYVPVDVPGDGGAGAEADPNISAMTSFTSPLLVGELRNFYLTTTVNLNATDQNMFLVSSGYLDVVIVGGRLVDEYAHMGYTGVLNASLFFDLGSANFGVTNEYEFTDNGTMQINAVPEPSVGLLMVGSLVGLAMRKRRK